jgi:hypothetical protein
MHRGLELRRISYRRNQVAALSQIFGLATLPYIVLCLIDFEPGSEFRPGLTIVNASSQFSSAMFASVEDGL